MSAYTTGSSRRILPAPASPTEDKRGPWDKGTTVPAQKQKQLLKRTQITAVACQPCQQRKSKCDGARPICSSCVTKKRTDCTYDTAGDQRRTAALKQRIKVLEKQIHEVKELVRVICSAADKDAAITIVQKLQLDDLRNLDQVCGMLGGVKRDVGRLVDSQVLQGMATATDPRLAALFTQTLPPPIDPALMAGLSESQPQSSSWMLDMGSDSATGDGPWTYENSPIDVADQRWGSGSAYLLGSPSPMQGYNVPSMFPTPSTRSGSQSIRSTPAREMCQDDSRRPSQQSQYWYRQGKTVTHVQFFANLVGPQNSKINPDVESTPIPIHTVQPLNDVDDDALTAGTAAFIRAKRELIKEGWPIEQVLGSEELDTTLLSPKDGSEVQSPHLSNLTVGQWTSNIFERISDIRTPEKLAMTLLGVLFLRWSILPSLELYQKLPEWMRPTPIQMIVPHPQWIDFLPWPEARDLFINDPMNGEMTDAFQTLMTNTSINWPLGAADVVTLRADVDSLQLNPTFETYVKDISNWSLNPAVLTVFPALANKAWITPLQDEDDSFQYDVAPRWMTRHLRSSDADQRDWRYFRLLGVHI